MHFRDGQCPEYSGEEQAICAVGFARSKPGIFVEAIQYLLVLATPVEVGIWFLLLLEISVFLEQRLQPLSVHLPTSEILFSLLVFSTYMTYYIDMYYWEISFSPS